MLDLYNTFVKTAQCHSIKKCFANSYRFPGSVYPANGRLGGKEYMHSINLPLLTKPAARTYCEGEGEGGILAVPHSPEITQMLVNNFLSNITE